MLNDTSGMGTSRIEDCAEPESPNINLGKSPFLLHDTLPNDRSKAISTISGLNKMPSPSNLGNLTTLSLLTKSEKDRIDKQVNDLTKTHVRLDGRLDCIVRKPFCMDDSPIKCLPNTLGRKNLSVSPSHLFILEEAKQEILAETFKLGEHFTNDELELGNIFVKGENVLQKELTNALSIPGDQRILIKMDEDISMASTFGGFK
jgi:hypothetical protein